LNEYKIKYNQAKQDVDKLNLKLEEQLKRVEYNDFQRLDMELSEMEIEKANVQNVYFFPIS